jgi:hypothetical protein
MPIDLVQSFGIRAEDTLVGKLTAHFDKHLNCIAKPDIPFSLNVSSTGHYWQKEIRMTAHPATRQLGLVVGDGIEFVIEKVVRLEHDKEVEYPLFPDRTVEDLSFEPKA